MNCTGVRSCQKYATYSCDAKDGFKLSNIIDKDFNRSTGGWAILSIYFYTVK